MLKKLLLATALSGIALTAAQAETLTARAVTPNPLGSLDQLYIVRGNTVGDEALNLDLEPRTDLPEAGQSHTIRILHINDIHGHLVDYHRKGDTHRMAQISKLVKLARSDAGADESVLFLSIGDEHIGTVWDELLGSNAEDFQISAPYVALSAAGLDMAAVGNHELDKGSALLARAIEQDADFPVLTANLAGSKYAMPWAPAAIGIIDGVRIGFIGLTSVHDTYLETEQDPTLKGYDPAVVTEAVTAALSDHVDMIVVMSHVGFNGQLSEGQALKYDLEVGDVQIAEAAGRATDKPVLVLGGHSHTVLNQNGLSDATIIENVPVAQAGEYGKFLGEVTATLTFGANGAVTGEFGAQLIGIKGRDEENEADLDLALQRDVLDPIKARLDTRLEAPIGRVVPAPELSDDQVVLDRYIGETAIANFMNDAIVARSQYWPTGPVDFAAFNATGMRGVDMEGDLTFAEWYKVMPYADEIIVFSLTGAQIKEIVEDNARRIVRPEELAANGGALDPSSFISRGFQHYSAGIRYEIDLGSNPMETKAVNITLNGKPIDGQLDQSFTMVFNSYVSNGREGYDGGSIKGLPAEIKGFNLDALRQEVAKNTYLLYRGQIIDYIREEANGVVSAQTGARYDERVIVR